MSRVDDAWQPQPIFPLALSDPEVWPWSQAKHVLAVVEDRLELLAVWAGPVDCQLGDNLIYGGDHGACFFHAA
jgi:hypothetical protein